MLTAAARGRHQAAALVQLGKNIFSFPFSLNTPRVNGQIQWK